MTPEPEAASPAVTIEVKKGDEGKRSGNLSLSAAQSLLAQAATAAHATRATTAAEETAPAEAEPTQEAPAAEAEPKAPAEVAAEEPAPEAEPEDATENDVPSQSSFDEKARAKMQSRIDKVTAKAKTAETQAAEASARIAALEARLAEVGAQAPQAPAPQPSGNGDLNHINDPRKLMEVRKEASDALKFAEDTLEDPDAWQTREDPETGKSVRFTKVNIGGQEQEFTDKALRMVRRQAKTVLDEALPQREKFLLARLQATEKTVQRFPSIADPKSPDYVLAQQIRRTNLWLANHANEAEIIAIQIKGIRAIEAEQAAAAEAKEAAAKPKPKPAPVKPSSDQAAVSSTATASRAPGANSAAKGRLVEHQKKIAEKRTLTAGDAVQSLLLNQQFRKSR